MLLIATLEVATIYWQLRLTKKGKTPTKDKGEGGSNHAISTCTSFFFIQDPFSPLVKIRQHQGADKWEETGNSSWVGKSEEGLENISSCNDIDWWVLLKGLYLKESD